MQSSIMNVEFLYSILKDDNSYLSRTQVRLATSRHWRTLSVKGEIRLRRTMSLVSPSQSVRTEDITVAEDEEVGEVREERM